MVYIYRTQNKFFRVTVDRVAEITTALGIRVSVTLYCRTNPLDTVLGFAYIPRQIQAGLSELLGRQSQHSQIQHDLTGIFRLQSPTSTPFII